MTNDYNLVNDAYLTIDSGSTFTNAATGYIVGPVTGNMVNNGTLYFMDTAHNTYSGIISGTGEVVIDVSSYIIFTGANTYTGETYIEHGALWLGNGTTAGTLSALSNILDNGSIDFLEPSSETLTNTVTGHGVLYNCESNTITIPNSSGFTGTTSGSIVL